MSYDEEVYEKLLKNFELLCGIIKQNTSGNTMKADLSRIEEIINKNKGKKCILYNSYFKPKANNQRHCLDCATKQKKSEDKERKRKQRALIFSLKAK